MRLTEALRLAPGSAAAFVGAGGKSSSLKRLGAEAVFSPTILATTTKIFLHQSGFAEEHHILTDRSQLPLILERLESAHSLFLTGGQTGDNLKWTGVEGDLLEPIYMAVRDMGGIMAVEADGARGGSLKAPADYEPVVPGFVNLLVPTAGMDVLGSSLDSVLIHRPHLVEQIVGGIDQVTPETIALVLSSPEGGLKNLPQNASVRIILNKVESEHAIQQARETARLLLEHESVEAVLLASLTKDGEVHEVWGRTAGVVLAAGEARRYGAPKQLQEWHGETFVHRAARTAMEAGLGPVFVVTGAYEDKVRAAVADLPVELVHNPDWRSGQGSSVQAGVRKLPDQLEAACFMLADMPGVGVELVRSLLERHHKTLASITAPVYEGRQGNPVLFDRRTFSDLSMLSGEEGGRRLFCSYGVDQVPWDDSILVDIDTAEDLRHLDR